MFWSFGDHISRFLVEKKDSWATDSSNILSRTKEWTKSLKPHFVHKFFDSKSCWRTATDIALCKCQGSCNKLCFFSSILCSACSPSAIILRLTTSMSNSLCTTSYSVPNVISLSLVPPPTSTYPPSACPPPLQATAYPLPPYPPMSTYPPPLYPPPPQAYPPGNFISLSWQLSSTTLRRSSYTTKQKAT